MDTPGLSRVQHHETGVVQTQVQTRFRPGADRCGVDGLLIYREPPHHPGLVPGWWGVVLSSVRRGPCARDAPRFFQMLHGYRGPSVKPE